MQQVNRIKKVFFVVFVAIFFTSCATKNVKVENADYKKRVYEGVSKDAILEAAKKIFIFAGDRKFLIDSYRSSMTAIKVKVNAYPMYAYTSKDIWTLSVEQKDNRSKTKLEIKRIIDFDEKNPAYFKKDLYDFFYSRLDYLLGIKTKWYTCEEYSTIFNHNQTLCDVDLQKVVTPNKDDIVEDIYITERKDRYLDKSVENKEDLLADDIVLTLEDEPKDDILNQVEEEANEESELIDTLDKEINALDKKVNDNIDETLDKIKTLEE